MRFRNSVASSISLITIAASLSGCYGSSTLPATSAKMFPEPVAKRILPSPSALYSPQIQYGPQVSVDGGSPPSGSRPWDRTRAHHSEQDGVMIRCNPC